MRAARITRVWARRSPPNTWKISPGWPGCRKGGDYDFVYNRLHDKTPDTIHCEGTSPVAALHDVGANYRAPHGDNRSRAARESVVGRRQRERDLFEPDLLR